MDVEGSERVCIDLIVMSSMPVGKILKYTLCGDYGYACGEGAESIFLLIYPSHPERLCGATDEI